MDQCLKRPIAADHSMPLKTGRQDCSLSLNAAILCVDGLVAQQLRQGAGDIADQPSDGPGQGELSMRPLLYMTPINMRFEGLAQP